MTTKDSKHWANKGEAARDEFKDAVAESLDWAVKNKKRLAAGVGAFVAAAALAAVFLYSRKARENAAWDKLARAELLAYSGRPQEAESLLKELTQAGAGGSAGGLARIMEGDLYYPRGEYDKAAAAYQQAAEEAPESLKPYALADKISALAAAGKHAECAAQAQSFLDTRGDHLLAPSVHASLARCQLASGQADAAQSTLQKIVLQYPGTSWAQWASSRVKK